MIQPPQQITPAYHTALTGSQPVVNAPAKPQSLNFFSFLKKTESPQSAFREHVQTLKPTTNTTTIPNGQPKVSSIEGKASGMKIVKLSDGTSIRTRMNDTVQIFKNGKLTQDQVNLPDLKLNLTSKSQKEQQVVDLAQKKSFSATAKSTVQYLGQLPTKAVQSISSGLSKASQTIKQEWNAFNTKTTTTNSQRATPTTSQNLTNWLNLKSLFSKKPTINKQYVPVNEGNLPGLKLRSTNTKTGVVTEHYQDGTVIELHATKVGDLNSSGNLLQKTTKPDGTSIELFSNDYNNPVKRVTQPDKTVVETYTSRTDGLTQKIIHPNGTSQSFFANAPEQFSF